MKELTIFHALRESGTRIPYSPNVSASVLFDVAKVAHEGGIATRPPSPKETLAQINSPYPNAALDKVIDILRDAGWEPGFGHVARNSVGKYSISIVREYAPEDLDAADLLYLEAAWGEWPIFRICWTKRAALDCESR